jgi:alpha,alpha-trehalose phosphorylase
VQRRRLRIEVTGGGAAYLLLDGEPLEILHHGQALLVTTAKRLRRPIPAPPARTTPTQPPGRAPARRRPQPAPPEHTTGAAGRRTMSERDDPLNGQ